jgi:hypothetical protein
MNFKKNSPRTDSATKCSIGSLEKFNVAIVRVAAHFFEGDIDVLEVRTRHIAKVTRSWLS